MADENSKSNNDGNETNESASDSKDIDFEEERKILLQSMSEQLQQVLERMGQANANLEQLADQGQVVQDVASLWRAAFQKRHRPHVATAAAAAAATTGEDNNEDDHAHQESSRSSLSAPGLG